MSRIGRMPIAIPAGITVEVAENNKVTVKGPKGTLERVLPSEMSIKVEGAEVVVSRPNDLKKMKSLHGLTRTLINNMVIGVANGYEKVLEVNGVGYRAQKQGKTLVLSLGYSHPVEMVDPEGIEAVVEGQNKIIVKGIDKEKVGQYAAEIRSKRGPEPYKGKGIKYADETIRRKVGSRVLQSVPVWLYSEAIIICMPRSLMMSLRLPWFLHPPLRKKLRLSWRRPTTLRLLPTWEL